MRSSKVRFVVFQTVGFVVVVMSLVFFFYNSFGKPEEHAFFWDYPRDDVKDYEEARVPISPEPIHLNFNAFSQDLKIKNDVCFVDAKVDQKSESISLVYWVKIFDKGEEIVFKTESESKKLSDTIKIPFLLRQLELKDYSKFHLEEIKAGSNQIRAILSYSPDSDSFWLFTAIVVVMLGIVFYFTIFCL